MTLNSNRIVVFDDIQIGKRFKTGSDITYQKISIKKAKPILDSSGNTIANGRESSAFYNSKIKLSLI